MVPRWDASSGFNDVDGPLQFHKLNTDGNGRTLGDDGFPNDPELL
jgi:hypothetical protein